MNDKIIGILGGMGPEATADLFMKIIKATKVDRDQDHFRIIIDNNPKIPDRTEYILGLGENPIPYIIETGKNLEKAGADIACIPCITSHYFIEEVKDALDIPILNAIEASNNYIRKNYPDISKVGILSTSGTRQTKLFEKYIKNYSVIYPNDKVQEEKVMEAIYGSDGIKSGNTGSNPLKLLKEAADELVSDGAEILISGCTEIALVLKPDHLDVPLLDPMQILAETIIE